MSGDANGAPKPLPDIGAAERHFTRFGLNKKRIRRELFFAQAGRCFYCCAECWEGSVETRDKAASRLGFPEEVGGGGWRRTVEARRATLDHLRARRRGGKDVVGNLVMACHACNVAKKDLPYAEWARRVAAAFGTRSTGSSPEPVLRDGPQRGGPPDDEREAAS